ncbi:MAG TPA: tetratricopeptide repeat protein [Vicinamibacterales bacterium]|nr:tetratricopeptide repeat protein [Vicinamibacterales bacterium]
MAFRVVPRPWVLAAVLALVPLPASAQSSTADAYFEFLMARRFEAEGDNRAALAALERAAKAAPDSAEVQAEIAAFHLRRNDRAAAEKFARAALGIDEKNVEANRTLGLIYAAAVDNAAARTPAADTERYLRDAIAHLERAIAGMPLADSNLLFTLGRLYTRAGAADKAVQTLTRVITQNPGSRQGRLALAQAYAAGQDLNSAIATLEEVVEDDPALAGALGQYQEQAGRLEDAVASYTLALAVQPNNALLKLRRISVLYTMKEYDRAAALAAEGRKQHPEDLRFVRLQARALFDAGDRSGAIALVEAAVRAFPKDVQTQYALADLYRDSGRDLDAEKTLRQILAIDPTNANALNYLGYLLALRGERLDEAISLVRRALDADPDNGAYLDSLGWAYFRRGDLDEAEKYLSAAAARLPENSEIQDHLGDVYARRGRLQEAIAAWRRALEGDMQDVDRAVIEQKIRDAQSKLQNAR